MAESEFRFEDFLCGCPIRCSDAAAGVFGLLAWWFCGGLVRGAAGPVEWWLANGFATIAMPKRPPAMMAATTVSVTLPGLRPRNVAPRRAPMAFGWDGNCHLPSSTSA